MTRLHGDAGTPPAGDDQPSRTGLRLFAGSVVLAALCVVQDPGMLVADTKLDLVVDPGASLERALTLWDGQGAFGQVGNQTYGYLWPMGPFFLAGDLLGAPGWLIQRLWLALVVVVAFQGAARLARALGVRGDTALLVSGVAYALSPRLLTTLGPISIEAWPSAVAPWVLLALVRGSQQGSARRAAVAAGLAVGMVGGVNAAATFAVIPLGAVWLLTREAGPRRRTLMLWWPVATALSCLWWLVPLVVLGRYSPPFLDYIETSSVTTYPTTLFNSLRGTSAWVPYVDPRWRAGSDLITTPLLVLNSTVVLALGLAGLVRRDHPHRVFLASGLLVGLLMVTAGHSGAAEGWLAPDVRALLDGVLAPLRNVHKFDPIIRLPLVLGLGHLVSVTMLAWHRWRADAPGRPRLGEAASRLGPVWLAVVAVAGAAIPAGTGRLTPAESFAGIPDYWQQTADWLAEEGEGDQALLLPGSSFGDYAWGNTQDEPLQALARSPWAVRNAIPLAPAGTIRSLDAIEERLQRGDGSAALTAYLRRMGVRWLVVRNDLDRSGDVVDPTLVHQAVATSPGLVFRTAFGPLVGGESRLEGDDDRVAVIAYGWQTRYAAVEIFEVMGGQGGAVTTTSLPVVVGGPEDLLTLAEHGLVEDQPTRLAVDTDPTRDPGAPVVLTDGLRGRDRVFGRLHDAATPALTGAERDRLAPVRDFGLTPAQERWRTRAWTEGARDLIASSSEAYSRRVITRSLTRGSYAAFDNDPETAWVSDPFADSTPWIRLLLREPSMLSTVEVTVGPEPETTSELWVRTENGTSDPVFVEPGDTLRLALPPGGPTRWVEVAESSGQPGRQLSVAEIDLPGISVRRWLVTPELPVAWGAPEYISLDNGVDAASGCVLIEASLRCSPQRQVLGEDSGAMRRIVRLPATGQYRLALRAVPRPGAAVTDLLTRDALTTISASSRSVQTVSAAGPLAAADGDPGTTWISSALDPSPSLDLSWVRPRRLRSLELALDPGAPAREPTEVVVSYAGGSQRVTLDDGRAELEPVKVDRVTVLIDGSTEVQSIGFDRSVDNLGAGVSEIAVNDKPLGPLGVSPGVVDFGCGSGPHFRLQGQQSVRTAVVASPFQVHLGRPVDLRVCGSDTVTLAAGKNRLRLRASEAFSPRSMVLTRLDADPSISGDHRAAARGDDGVLVEGGSGTLVLRHNENPGWQASADGQKLAPLTVDGWQQGFALDGAPTTVQTRFAPASLHQWGLGVGAGTFLLAALLLVVFRRRPGDVHAPSLGAARAAPLLAAAGWLAAGGLFAGWVGAAVLGIAAALLWVARSRWEVVSTLALVPVAAVGVWYAVRPWADPLGWAGSPALTQWLMLVPLAAVAVAAVLDRPRLRNRDSGRSTSQ